MPRIMTVVGFNWLLFMTSVGYAQMTVTTVATFECMSVYVASPQGDRGECQVQYKASGAASWRDGYPLVYDERDKEYRGSLIGLRPDMPYDVKIECGGQTGTGTGRTRSDVFPIGKATSLDAEIGETVKITESGAADGYHLVTPRAGSRSTIDVFNLSDHCVEIDADFVILRGVELKNAAIHSVIIRPGRHDVVIEDCRMTFWGRIGGPRSMGNIFHGSDSGIYAEKGAGRLVLQRNRIENPRGAANDWYTGHPSGPQGISLINSSGGNIIRYNEIVTTDDHGFNDGFGGGSNFSFEGSPNCDSDIYGNIIEGVWDDAIEAEGANMNVRIWGNYMSRTNQFVATADISRGPCYIFRNILALSRHGHEDYSGGTMYKVGDHTVQVNGQEVRTGTGRRFIFHNTSIQPNGGARVFSGGKTNNTVTRNNILWVSDDAYPEEAGDPPNDFQNDFLAGRLSNLSQMYLPSHYLEYYLSPRLRRIQYGKTDVVRQERTVSVSGMMVDAPNPGIDGGVRLPGFNDEYQGTAPDMGAFETGAPPLRFGRRAQPDAPWAPWELYQ